METQSFVTTGKEGPVFCIMWGTVVRQHKQTNKPEENKRRKEMHTPNHARAYVSIGFLSFFLCIKDVWP